MASPAVAAVAGQAQQAQAVASPAIAAAPGQAQQAQAVASPAAAAVAGQDQQAQAVASPAVAAVAGQDQQGAGQVPGQHAPSTSPPSVVALPAMVEQAAAVATQNAQVATPQAATPGVATSTSHRAEYMAFLRAARHPCHPQIPVWFNWEAMQRLFKANHSCMKLFLYINIYTIKNPRR